MNGHATRRAATSIGALTRKDRCREAALRKKIKEAYRGLETTSSVRGRRRLVRAAHRHERALIAQRQRPQSALTALAFALVAVLVASTVTRPSFTVAIIVGALLAVDLCVLRWRRHRLRRS